MKKVSRKIVSLLLVATMVMAMGLTSFAAAPDGAYSVTLKGPSGTTMTHGNPITGADIDEDEETLTIYAETLTVNSTTGYISSLTIGNASSIATTSATNSDGITYISAFTYRLSEVSALASGSEVSINYSITYVISGGETSHRATTGSIQLVARS